MTVLVTGATGFVGLNIVQWLARSGADVIAMDRGTPDEVAATVFGTYAAQIRSVSGDVRDRDVMCRLVGDAGVRRIVHAAALTPSVAAERDDPAVVMDVNLGGTLNMLEAARLGSVEERVVVVSSTGLYGSPEGRTLPIHEDQPLVVDGLYSVAKQASEHLVARYAAMYDLSAVVGRLGSAYGSYERPTSARSNMSQVYRLVHAALAGRSVRIAGAALPRDLCYAADIGEAFGRLALAPELHYPIFNVSAGEAPTLAEIADAVAAEVPGWRWEATDDAAHADMVVLASGARGPLDLSRLRMDLGWTPRYPLSEGIRDYVRSLREQP